MGILSDLLGGVASDLYNEIPDTITDLYNTELPLAVSPDMTFKPFTVTSNAGNISTQGDGSTDFALSPEQQLLQQQLFSGAGSLFSQAAMGTAGREQEIYDRIRATQSPEEQRQRLMMEERLHNQGRLGVQTNMFGGTPEAFAMEQAQAEAGNKAMLLAMQQAQTEQQQQANIGGQFMEASYLPQAQLLASFAPSLDVASMADVARRQQGEYDLQTQMMNLSGKVGQQTALGSLYGSMFSGAGGLIGSLTGASGDLATTVIDKFFPDKK